MQRAPHAMRGSVPAQSSSADTLFLQVVGWKFHESTSSFSCLLVAASSTWFLGLLLPCYGAVFKSGCRFHTAVPSCLPHLLLPRSGFLTASAGWPTGHTRSHKHSCLQQFPTIATYACSLLLFWRAIYGLAWHGLDWIGLDRTGFQLETALLFVPSGVGKGWRATAGSGVACA